MCLRATRPSLLRLTSLSGRSLLQIQPQASQSLNAGSAFDLQHRRWYSPSTVDEPAKIVGYKEVSQALTDPKTTIIDVREVDEYNKGHIPGALNIPFRSSPGALGLESSDFEEAFGFPKPELTKKLVFYCKSGVRSAGAEQLAATYGYQSRENYEGSYADWVANGGKVDAEPAPAETTEAEPEKS